jgi:hypothetical protein
MIRGIEAKAWAISSQAIKVKIEQSKHVFKHNLFFKNP